MFSVPLPSVICDCHSHAMKVISTVPNVNGPTVEPNVSGAVGLRNDMRTLKAINRVLKRITAPAGWP